MNETVKKVLYGIGIIVAIYIAIKYVLPLILKLLGFVIDAVFSVTLWAIMALAVLFVVVYVVRMVKS